MKNKVMSGVRQMISSRGLPLVALAVLGMVTVLPGWASAQSDTTATTFTSPLPGGHHGGPHDEIRELLETIVDRDAVLADVLGITVEELAAAKEAGTSIGELIEQAGLDKETVRTEIQNAIGEAVQQAVTDGVITQEQADLILTPPAPREQGNDHGHGHQRPGDHEDDNATPTPTIVATAPADGTPTAETTPEATSVATTATGDNAATNGEQRHPRHQHDDAAQNNDTSTSDTTTSSTDAGTTASSDTTASDTTSGTTEESTTNTDQPANDRPDRGGNHQRPGR